MHNISLRISGWSAGSISYINDYERLIIYLFSENNEISNKYLNGSIKTKSKVPTPKSKIMEVKKNMGRNHASSSANY
ncbi:MAG: hypothetical protein H0U57_11310 [Tatlockia sp.]|nr:hypothetical protein [Tatlockia sp.]